MMGKIRGKTACFWFRGVFWELKRWAIIANLCTNRKLTIRAFNWSKKFSIWTTENRDKNFCFHCSRGKWASNMCRRIFYAGFRDQCESGKIGVSRGWYSYPRALISFNFCEKISSEQKVRVVPWRARRRKWGPYVVLAMYCHARAGTTCRCKEIS